MVTSSRDSFTEKKQKKKKEPRSYHCQQTLLFPRIIPHPPPHPYPSPTFKKYSVILSLYGNIMEDNKVKNPNW